LQIGDWSDDEIVTKTNDITAAMIGCSVAMERGDRAWLERHEWFAEAAARLLRDHPAVPLDG